MAAKPRIAMVGAGNLAGVLALSLRRAGYVIDEIVARDSRASLRRASLLAKEAGARAVAATRARVNAEVVWFCVPDGAIAATARSLEANHKWKGRVALHSSGALTSDELDVLRRRGAAVASVHPLMTFVKGSRPALAGVPFAIEGDEAAVRAARRIVRDVFGQPYPIRKQDKAAYHAWGTFASPLLTALLATTEQVAKAAGVKRKAAKKKMLPILLQTIVNYAELGAAGSFSGPLVRGDVATVARHLGVLRRVPAAVEVYGALAGAAMKYLPVKKRARLRKMLKF